MEAAASPDSESLEKKTTTKRFDGPNMVSSSLAGSIVCVSLLERRGTFALDALPVALRAFRLGDRDVRLFAQDMFHATRLRFCKRSNVPKNGGRDDFRRVPGRTVQVGQSPASMPPGPREDRCGPRTPRSGDLAVSSFPRRSSPRPSVSSVSSPPLASSLSSYVRFHVETNTGAAENIP